MSKQKVNLDRLMTKPAQSMDDLLLGNSPSSQIEPTPQPTTGDEAKIRFTNALPPDTFRRLQQYTFWSHETIGDVLNDALLAYLDGKPEADREIPAKQAKRRRLPPV
ncbi:hypothetical protein K3G63_22100 [Hymenobacter sp. HSC-4F20]|uniref:hypothetical protein n=1 Tax=Hymenobacter sp. HSC-4F20 TaxID=2864135 RepID=UPI001C73584A|nr:hypothetical protein [Hymenobacter sp. HSC-4F20]MBX0293154.1 hypothetical protein [Hymenobacter sp. HSC-4F20]